MSIEEMDEIQVSSPAGALDLMSHRFEIGINVQAEHYRAGVENISTLLISFLS